MKLNKILSTLAAVATSVLVCHKASATLLLTEQFSGYATGALGAAGTGGTGLIPGWISGSTNVEVVSGSHSLDGTSLGLVSSAGDKVNMSATATLTTYNKFCNSGTFPQTVQTNIYYSFLYRFNVGTDVSAAGQTIIQVVRQNSSTAVNWLLVAQNAGGGNVQLGIAKPAGTVTNFAPNLIAPGQIVFVVVRQQIIPGAANDIDDLWIDPPLNTFGTNEANVPAVSATTSNGTEDASATGPGRFYIASGANANLDELRIATTWAEATPPAGQCLSANITTDPTNVTQVAEIQATFTAAAAGTSPTYQWQISQNAGAFSNITGATASSFTTSNLNFATDNGNKYRMIATVSCNGTSDTSAVATVTLTQPVPTAPGLVMFDQFQDQLRDNEPVLTNNSVWRTETSADLSAFPGPGMTGIPVSGSSSLWLGYFCSDTNPPVDLIADPVDLAVGTTIQVTLPFTPASYGSFTNNGTMRFGLYDYADGGVFLTNDSSAAGGSTGNGQGVRGYMLSLDFGPTFSVNSPLSLLARSAIGDVNLMGTTGDYASMGSGPNGGGFSNTTAFTAGTQYTLVFSVARTDVNSCTVTAAISGGVTNMTFSSTETNFAYHRFDAFGMRPNSLETTADSFFFPTFTVQVLQNSLSPFKITITQPTGNSVVLTWPSVANTSYEVQSAASLTSPTWVTDATIMASGTTTSFTNSPLPGSSLFFRVVSP